MRGRDLRAIVFCLVTTAAVTALAAYLSRSWVIAAGLTLAYDALVLTRPRMLRVFRRMRGERVEASRGYHWD